ncbi:preprotein translocase subunit SecE [Proteiniclasticum sp. BAD-10]|jgi:preprotein translocase subunit SecE|uniref:Protein translocase subunit SecE n=1 Tax=Proteiniclasticum sediminis TaxID=2804028 RepID=A0A941CPF0_9CLOT|nr:preprotein translocase subunit SecE [Proteiniclasticum sediminis]MBR0576322.1 preprotein translocase subunit SecE [Proteiniclasticum sediminis]
MASKTKGLVDLVKGVKNELNKITWPSKEEVKKAVSVVSVICAIYVVLIAIADVIYKGILTEILYKL